MNEDTTFGLAGMAFAILLIALAVVLIVHWMKVWQTKIQTAKEEGYQKLATDAVELQKATAQQQKEITEEMKELNKRLSSIEQILKEVE